MDLFTKLKNNLLRKLRWSKTKPVKEFESPLLKDRLPGTAFEDYLQKSLNQEDKPKHFKGDIFNGWEEDGEPGQQLPVATHFSSRYFDKRRPK
jgi:hypothetical protein|tara:strand:+ start:326 stop:604 length:279 start_codon:yes stop_codon:yes gene_type:complete